MTHLYASLSLMNSDVNKQIFPFRIIPQSYNGSLNPSQGQSKSTHKACHPGGR